MALLRSNFGIIDGTDLIIEEFVENNIQTLLDRFQNAT